MLRGGDEGGMTRVGVPTAGTEKPSIISEF